MKKKYELPCNIAQTLNIIGDRWTLLIIHEILTGEKTYKELETGLRGIASNLLSKRLKELEENGIIKSSLYQQSPPRYNYSITEKGRDLKIVFNAIIMWGHKNLDICYKKIVDKKTGVGVEMKYYNPVTGAMLNDDEIEIKDV